MNILIIAATELELNPHKALLNKYKSVDCYVTGIGQALTAYYLTKLLYSKKYDIVISVGIAGYYSNELKIGDTVVVKEDTFADLGIGSPEGNKSIFQEKLLSANEYPFIKGWMECPFIETYKAGFLKKVKGITLNTSTGEESVKQNLIQRYQPDIETMEGAALFYVCLCEKLPFLQIRTMSNLVESRNINRWNIPLALQNSSQTVHKLIRDLL